LNEINKFYFITVNYNNHKITIDFIKNVLSLSAPVSSEKQIIVVDNASSVDDVKSLDSYCKSLEDVVLIKSDSNLGYFKGLNRGLDFIKNKDKAFFIICNNDIIFDSSFLINLNELLFEDEVFIISPNIITKDGKQQNPLVVNEVDKLQKIKARIFFINYYLALFLRFSYSLVKPILESKPRKTNDYPQMKIKRGIGACYVLTPNFIKFFNRLDDRVFMWGEEALLSHQIETVGGVTLYVPSLLVHHLESATVSAMPTKQRYNITKRSYKIYKHYW
jgi:GT2 family glycosyltransferase